MATTSDLRKGMLIRYNGSIHRVIEYQHISPGNWRAFVRMRLKNFDSGKIIEDRVRAGSEVDVLTTETHTAQFLYKAAGIYYFMNTETYDQIELTEEAVGDRMEFVKENENVDLLVLDTGQILDVEPPTFAVLRVTEADVAVRGDTTTNLQKNVTLETGAIIKAPAFVKEGDLVRIDTRSGEYVDRAKE